MGLDLEQLRLFLASAPDAMLIVDEAGAIVLANGLAEDQFGAGPGALDGVAVDDLVPRRMRPAHGGHRGASSRTPPPGRWAPASSSTPAAWTAPSSPSTSASAPSPEPTPARALRGAGPDDAPGRRGAARASARGARAPRRPRAPRAGDQRHDRPGPHGRQVRARQRRRRADARRAARDAPRRAVDHHRPPRHPEDGGPGPGDLRRSSAPALDLGGQDGGGSTSSV